MEVNEFGEIISANQKELFEKYLKEEYYKEFSFKEFLNQIERQGTKIEQ